MHTVCIFPDDKQLLYFIRIEGQTGILIFQQYYRFPRHFKSLFSVLRCIVTAPFSLLPIHHMETEHEHQDTDHFLIQHSLTDLTIFNFLFQRPRHIIIIKIICHGHFDILLCSGGKLCIMYSAPV